MMQGNIDFSAHARARMIQRGITERQVLMILNGGHRVPEPAPAGAANRWRYSGASGGRQIAVIAAEEGTGLVVITAY